MQVGLLIALFCGYIALIEGMFGLDNAKTRGKVKLFQYMIMGGFLLIVLCAVLDIVTQYYGGGQ